MAMLSESEAKQIKVAVLARSKMGNNKPSATLEGSPSRAKGNGRSK
jgi:hypothetical protein